MSTLAEVIVDIIWPQASYELISSFDILREELYFISFTIELK